MTEGTDRAFDQVDHGYDDEVVPLRHYALIVLRQWKVVTAVFVVVVAYALVTALLTSAEYASRTRLLIVTRLAERVEQGGLDSAVSESLSVDVLSALGTAGNLFQQIIDDVGLADPDSGKPWSVEQLFRRVEVNVETRSDRPNQTTTLPLLTMTASSDDPAQAQQIAEAWARLFVEENSRFLQTEAARTYDFVESQYEQKRVALQQIEQEKLAYLRANPLGTLQGQLTVLSSTYQTFLGELQSKRALLVREQAGLESAREAIADESEFIDIEQTITSDVLLLLLANNPQSIDPDSFPELVSSSQVFNDLYFSLKQQIVAADSAVSTLTSEISYLEGQVAEMAGEIDDLSAQIATVTLTTTEFDREIGLLTADFEQLGRSLQEAQLAREEQSGSIQVVEQAIEPTEPLPRGRMRSVLLAALLGVVLGVVAAFGVNFARGLRSASRDQEQQAPEVRDAVDPA